MLDHSTSPPDFRFHLFFFQESLHLVIQSIEYLESVYILKFCVPGFVQSVYVIAHNSALLLVCLNPGNLVDTSLLVLFL